jgi:hypothetical protein
MHSQARRARPAKSCPECVGQTLRARFVDTSQPSAECNFLDSHAAEYGRSARSDDRPAQWRVDDGRATRERWGRQEESRVCLKMRALFRPFSADVATSRKDHRLQQTAPNSRKSETIAARRPNSFSARSVVFEPPGCLPSPLPEAGLVAAGLCSVETGRPFKEQLALTAVACMPDEHSVPALMAVALRSAMARTG